MLWAKTAQGVSYAKIRTPGGRKARTRGPKRAGALELAGRASQSHRRQCQQSQDSGPAQEPRPDPEHHRNHDCQPRKAPKSHLPPRPCVPVHSVPINRQNREATRRLSSNRPGFRGAQPPVCGPAQRNGQPDRGSRQAVQNQAGPGQAQHEHQPKQSKH